MEIRTVGIVGAGQMGSGIAEVAIASGFSVLMRDITLEAVGRGRKRIENDLERRVQKGKLTAEERALMLSRLFTTTGLEDLRECDLIIEAASEQVSLKREIFEALDKITSRMVVLASNTSSISITRLAGFTGRPDRVIGIHFFNPAPVMKLVEIIRGLVTSDETFQAANDLALKLGKTPHPANDFPGFVSSRLIFNYLNEAIYTLYEGVGEAKEIDSIMKLGSNAPMGPLELADYVGLDTVLSVMRVLEDAFGGKYQPCPLLVKYVEAGYLGVKTGRGFYAYEQGK